MNQAPDINSYFSPSKEPETSRIKQIIDNLGLLKHPEGGYFVECDRDPLRIQNPFQKDNDSEATECASTRSAMTTIFYLLTPRVPQGVFHRNKGRTVHTLHKGRGRYVLVHADETKPSTKARIETFIVGQDVAKGERLQWIVDGGKYKASFLLPDSQLSDGSSDEGLLISETVVPGFEWEDHDFLTPEGFAELVPEEWQNQLRWLLKPTT